MCLVKFHEGTGEDHFLESKSNVFTARNEIAAVTFFAKTSTALTNRSAFASPTEWQDPGEHRCWFKVSSPACRLPIFAKAPCCLELFGCCWVGNVYRFFAVFFCVGIFCLFALFWWVCFWLVFVSWFGLLVVTSLRPSGLLQFTFDGLVYALITLAAGNVYRFWTPKGGSPQFSTWSLCHSSWLLWSHCFWWTFEVVGGVLSVMSQPQDQVARSNVWIWRARFLVSPAVK